MSSRKPEIQSRLAADDWGLSPAVNEAILELAEAGALRSVSLFANLPFTEHGLGALVRTGVPLAAHCNFTLGPPLSAAPTLRRACGSFPPLGAFMARLLLGRVAEADLLAEAEAQLARLQGLAPIVSVNGHQHVHLLPRVSRSIARAARGRGIRVVRRMDDPDHWPSRVAARWGEKAWGEELPGIVWEPTHCVWPTGRWDDAALARKLAAAGDRPLLVHPAAHDDFASVEFRDELRSDRVTEFHQLRRLLP